MPLGKFRMVSFGVGGKETPFALCAHAHETTEQATRCSDALANQRSLNAEASRAPGKSMADLFGELFR